MPYSLGQILLTVLFDFVAVFGFFFLLIACAVEASQRQSQCLSKYQSQYQSQCQSYRTQFHDRSTALPGTETLHLTLSLVPPVAMTQLPYSQDSRYATA